MKCSMVFSNLLQGVDTFLMDGNIIAIQYMSQARKLPSGVYDSETLYLLFFISVVNFKSLG